MNTTALNLGHNNPPSEAELLESRIVEANATLFNTAGDIISALCNITKECETDEDAGTLSDHIAAAGKKVKELDKTREAEKAPYLELGRKVDSIFKLPMDTITKERTRVNAILTRHLTKKAEEERRRRDEEARLLREKAQQEIEAAAVLEKAGMTQLAEKAATEARISEMTAQKTEASVAAKASTLAQSRGISGATSSLRTEWVGVLDNREQLDLNSLRQHISEEALQKAINAFVKAGGRTLSGARIFQQTTAATR